MDYDVIVVGGGPAGLTSAQAAAVGGARVLLLEKNSAIGIPVRSSGASSIDDMNALEIPPELWHPIKVIRFLSPNNSATFEYEKPMVCVVDVRRLYQFLAERASDAGADIMLNTTATGILAEGGTIQGVRARQRGVGEINVHSNVTIDASGQAAIIGRDLGISPQVERYGVGVEYDLYAPHYDEGEMLLVVGSNVAPCGYGWAFPYGNHRVRVGVGVIHPDTNTNPLKYMDKLTSDVDYLARRLNRAQPIEFHSGIIPAQPLNGKLVGPHFISVGDAASQASTLVGEGIRFAMKAGLLAGSAAARAVSESDFSEGFLFRNYEQIWRRQYGRPMATAYRVNLSIARYSDEKWDERVELLKLLTPEVLARALGTEMSVSLIFETALLGLKKPALLRMGFPKLLRKMLSRS